MKNTIIGVILISVGAIGLNYRPEFYIIYLVGFFLLGSGVYKLVMGD